MEGVKKNHVGHPERRPGRVVGGPTGAAQEGNDEFGEDPRNAAGPGGKVQVNP